MVCGKIAAGKSTLSRRLSAAPNTVLLVEDEWLSALFGDQMQTPADFLRCSTRLRTAIGAHVASLLAEGVSVVLDFQANTLEARAWLRDLITASGAGHQLHVLAPADEVCLARLKARNAAGTHPFAVSEAQFHQISRHFVLPTAEEGFNLVWHGAED